MNERTIGATFAPEELVWIDFETRSRVTPITAGTYRYAQDAWPIVLAYAIGDGIPQIWHSSGRALNWDAAPEKLLAAHERVKAGEAVYAAYHSAFDRAIWNRGRDGFPALLASDIIDVAAQAYPAGLGPTLKDAAKQVGGALKRETGKALIDLFCTPGSTAGPQTHPAQWAEFLKYAGDDIEAARGVFKATAQLTLAEWKEFWAAERVNEYGIGIDVDLAEAAASMADTARHKADQEVFTLTRGAVPRVTSLPAMKSWLLEALPPTGRSILIKREEETDENGVVLKPAKHQLRRPHIEKALAYCAAAKAEPELDWTPEQLTQLLRAERVLQQRKYGGSTTPAKFGRMLQTNVDGILRGQYVFNGAGQTGRFSAKGVQIHNLLRDALPYEDAAINALLHGFKYDQFATLGDTTPVTRKLAMLIRPTFIARNGNTFVWSDWSQIEARVLPWLANNHGGEQRLDIFREVDADPSKPDLYTRTASVLSHVPIEKVTKPMRQRGKVAELALGFGGGVGALQAMGAGYGLHLPDDEARTTVNGWRAANGWCVRYWEELMSAVNLAMQNPGTTFRAGRVQYLFLREYLHGSLVCMLPSGRVLTYRRIRHDEVDELNDDGEVIGKSIQLRCAKPYGRAKLWHGVFCENVVQATAADFLRGTIRRLVEDGVDVALHTHDEVLIEVEEALAEDAALMLREVMQRGFGWSEGLPLMSEETINVFYTKRED